MLRTVPNEEGTAANTSLASPPFDLAKFLRDVGRADCNDLEAIGNKPFKSRGANAGETAPGNAATWMESAAALDSTRVRRSSQNPASAMGTSNVSKNRTVERAPAISLME